MSDTKPLPASATFRVWRGEGDAGKFVDYTTPVSEGMVVLDAIHQIQADQAKVRARYQDERPAWLEAPLGKGKIVYVGHRVGLTYTAKKVRPGG